MKERPILFSAPMVRAILAGTKTQTRRIIKLPPAPDHLGGWAMTTFGGDGVTDGRGRPVAEHPGIWNQTNGVGIAAPYEVGSRLWVKETFAIGDDPPGVRIYKSDVHATDWRTWERFERRELRWKSSLFMRRSESRLELEVTNVRVERLQAITEDDARAEGVTSGRIPADDYGPERIGFVLGRDDGKCTLYPTEREAFSVGWDAINGKRAAWASNPFVWVVEFRRVELARSAA